MSVIGEMSSQEISNNLDISPGTVRYPLHEARKKLKKELFQKSKRGCDESAK